MFETKKSLLQTQGKSSIAWYILSFNEHNKKFDKSHCN